MIGFKTEGFHIPTSTNPLKWQQSSQDLLLTNIMNLSMFSIIIISIAFTLRAINWQYRGFVADNNIVATNSTALLILLYTLGLLNYKWQCIYTIIARISLALYTCIMLHYLPVSFRNNKPEKIPLLYQLYCHCWNGAHTYIFSCSVNNTVFSFVDAWSVRSPLGALDFCTSSTCLFNCCNCVSNLDFSFCNDWEEKQQQIKNINEQDYPVSICYRLRKE